MKALQLKSYGKIEESLAFSTIDKPKVQSQDLLIEVKAAAINPIDKSIILGNLQQLLPLALPCNLSYDVSGIIVETGDEVSQFSVGDSVYARVPQEQMGTIADFVAVNQQAVSLKPGNLSFEEAASIPLAGLTAFQSLEEIGFTENDKILVHAGSGGVGSFAIQYLKAKGAYVYTTTSTDNVSWVKELGADRVIDYKSEDYKEIAKGVDIVYDTLGQQYTAEAFEVIKQGGKVVSIVGPLDKKAAAMFGMHDYELPAEISKLCNEKEASYNFIFMHPNGVHLKEIKTMIEEDKIKAIVETVYPYEKSVDAFLHLASGRAKGKIVITMS